MAGSSPRLTITQGTLAGLLVWLAASAAAFALGTGSWRAGLIIGVIMGGVGGSVGLVLLARTMNGATSRALAGRAIGFFVRMILIMAGLVMTMRGYHSDPLAFVCAFFPMFFVFSGLEHLVALGAATTTQALPGAGGSL